MLGRGIIAKDLEAFQELGIISQLRGRDGAGVYRINTASTVYPQDLLFKGGSDFCNLLYDAETRKVSDPISRIFETTTANLFIGHNRAKTKGIISDENAHPFEFSNLVGAHNGTLKDKQYESFHQTDSELMFADMSERGIMPVLQELEDDSAFAVSIYNKTNRNVYFARNERRPLCFARIEDRNVLYWASEKGFLELVINRNGDKAKYFFIRDNFLFQINPTQYTYQDDKVFETVGVINQKKYEERKRLEEEWRAKLEAEKKKTEEAKATTVVEETTANATGEKKVEDKPPFNPPFLQTSTVLNFSAKKAELRSVPNTNNVVVNGVQPVSPKQAVNYPNLTFRNNCVKCECGKKILSVFDSYTVRKGTRIFPNYNSTTDTFYCGETCSSSIRSTVH